ncbi:MAG: hypothetical protein HY647_00430 [Acidobacteria bacterium]|nr:hypothetical protein [Acidobacteriota bacterium]
MKNPRRETAYQPNDILFPPMVPTLLAGFYFLAAGMWLVIDPKKPLVFSAPGEQLRVILTNGYDEKAETN